MPLAFTQEDFLVRLKHRLFVEIDGIGSSVVCIEGRESDFITVALAFFCSV